MSTQITWPSNLPQTPLLDAYSERFGEGVIQVANDAMWPKTRRVSSSAPRPVAVSFHMTAEQLDILDTFYHETLENGALSFYWNNFRTGEQVKVLMESSLEVKQIHNDLFKVLGSFLMFDALKVLRVQHSSAEITIEAAYTIDETVNFKYFVYNDGTVENLSYAGTKSFAGVSRDYYSVNQTFVSAIERKHALKLSSLGTVKGLIVKDAGETLLTGIEHLALLEHFETDAVTKLKVIYPITQTPELKYFDIKTIDNIPAYYVDKAVYDLDQNGKSNGACLINTNGTVSLSNGSGTGYDGITARTNLIGKGWTVTIS